jgi:hypothetical protein
MAERELERKMTTKEIEQRLKKLNKGRGSHYEIYILISYLQGNTTLKGERERERERVGGGGKMGERERGVENSSCYQKCVCIPFNNNGHAIYEDMCVSKLHVCYFYFNLF